MRRGIEAKQRAWGCGVRYPSCPAAPFVFFWEGEFPLKLKQPKKDALVPHGHWASEYYHNTVDGRISAPPEKPWNDDSPANTNK